MLSQSAPPRSGYHPALDWKKKKKEKSFTANLLIFRESYSVPSNMHDRIHYAQIPPFSIDFGCQGSTIRSVCWLGCLDHAYGTVDCTIGGIIKLLVTLSECCLPLILLIFLFFQLTSQNTWLAMTRFATSTPFNVFLYEGIETLFTLFIVISVQCVALIRLPCGMQYADADYPKNNNINTKDALLPHRTRFREQQAKMEPLLGGFMFIDVFSRPCDFRDHPLGLITWTAEKKYSPKAFSPADRMLGGVVKLGNCL
jgi:hypothetical protein